VSIRALFAGLSLIDISAAIASVCRLHALYVLTKTTDVPWDSPETTIWSTIELNIGIICASIPTLRAFFIRIWPKAFLSSFNSRKTAIGNSKETKGQFYNLEGTVRVKKNVAVESIVVSEGEDEITSQSSSHTGRHESCHVTADSQVELAPWPIQ
jgi:hypothetical protein